MSEKKKMSFGFKIALGLFAIFIGWSGLMAGLSILVIFGLAFKAILKL